METLAQNAGSITSATGSIGFKNPGARSSSAKTMFARLEMMRACYGGTETMRQMRELFLPQYPRETDERYEQRLNSTFCLNKLREAIDTASAKPFKNLLTLKDVPEDVSNWMWDVDLNGNHLHLFAHNHFNEAVGMGLSHILVDHPTTTNLASLGQQRSLNIRPFMKHIRAEDLLACYSERVGGENRVVHARIASTRIGFDRDTFRETVYDQVFVIEAGVVQLWERPRNLNVGGISSLGQGGTLYRADTLPVQYAAIDLSGSWELKYESPMNLDRVPLVTMIAGDQESEQCVRPIFQDLAYKQIEHWISSSDQRNILSAGRFAMLACSGVQIEETTDENGEQKGFEVGPWKVLTSPEAQGRWYYVEPEGAAIEAGQHDIEMLERQMDQLSLNPIISNPGRQYVAQNERSITENRVNTVIHDLAMSCRDSLQMAIYYMGLWTNRDLGPVEMNMNFDFSTTDQQSTNVASVLQAAAGGILSREGALRELQRLNLIEDSFDIEAELSRQTNPEVQQELEHQSKLVIAQATKKERDFSGGKTRPNA